jgi:1,4-alpha-glucan branching enzyme
MTSPIEFNLFAPRNKGAALIGSFSNWKEIPMEKGEDGYFRTQVELKDGVYQYKFRVQTKSPNFEPDQWVDVIDPYATDVNEPQGFCKFVVRARCPLAENYRFAIGWNTVCL